MMWPVGSESGLVSDTTVSSGVFSDDIHLVKNHKLALVAEKPNRESKSGHLFIGGIKVS